MHLCTGSVTTDESGFNSDQSSVPLSAERGATVLRNLPISRADSSDDFVTSIFHFGLAANVVLVVAEGGTFAIVPRAEELLVAGLAVIFAPRRLTEVILAADRVSHLARAVVVRVALVVDPLEFSFYEC